MFLIPASGRSVPFNPLAASDGLFMEFAELNGSQEAILGFASRYGLLDDAGFDGIDDWRCNIKYMREAVDAWHQARTSGAYRGVVELFGQQLRATSHVHLIEFFGVELPALRIVPESLISALWLQFAQAVTSKLSLQRCAVCTTWFAFGTGTGRRRSKQFCSDRCRKAAHRTRQNPER
jgi:hypothetical protein